VRAHHGSLSGPTRLRAEQDMKSGNLKAIVCTSSLELGIDIGAIDYCIQYGSPRQVTRFLQRVGRSGHRVDETAKGAMVAQDQDDALESIVIKARSRKRILEPIETPEKPYDVLMHGLTAMMIVERRWDVDEALLLVRKAYPFKDLSKEELVEVLRFMQDLGLARLSEGGNIFSRPPRYERVFSYYFQNLSMIPRMRQYLVVNDEDEMPVGILDEEFVVEYGEPGTKFVMGGLVWNIVQVFGNKVYVRGDENPVGAIPSWIGEEIPVPFSIAQEVGRIRGRVEEIAKEGCPLGSIVEEVAREYEVRQGTVAEAVQSTFAHYKRGIPTPTNNRIVIENFRDLIVIHAHLGTLVNRTLALFIVYMVSRMMFEAKATLIDPYRIVLRSEVVEPEDLVEMMRRPDVDLGEAVREIVEGSKFFEWRMIQVARRMGVVEEEAKMTSSVIDKLVRSLRSTPAFEEAFKEVAHKDLNPKEALTVLRKIRDGEIKVTSTGRLSEASPISDGIVKLHEKLLEPVTQDRVRLLAVASAKARLLSKVTTFICNECERYVEDKMVGTLPERPQCPKCGSYSLGMVEEPPERVKQMLLKTRKGVRRDKVLAEISSTSKLISRYGKPAAVALAGSGITPSLAEEVLKEGDWSTGRFYETVLEKERRALAQKFRWI